MTTLKILSSDKFQLRREAELKKNEALRNGLKQNGTIKENGISSNGTKHQNGGIHSNGSVHKHENGNGVVANGGGVNHKTDYSTVDSPTDLTRRKVQK